MPSCIRAVGDAFLARGTGRPAPASVAGLELVAGTLHAKLARLELGRDYAVAKINANVPGNPAERGLPTIQGILVLFDAATGVPLALMDSASITTLRTAAATAVAATHLARRTASSATFVGCGIQATAHLAALRHVRPIERVFAWDTSREAADRFARRAHTEHGINATVAAELRAATRASDVIVTSTPSRQPVLHRDDVSTGAFVAAVGADNEHKQEIDAALLSAAAVIVDDVAQCAHGGDLHHALVAGTMKVADVRASLDQVVAGTRRGRMSEDEIVVFDSTGLAIEDVAAAALVYERAEEVTAGAGTDVSR